MRSFLASVFLASLFSLGGCTGAGAKFAGSWTYAAGSSTITSCGATPPRVKPLAGAITISEGKGADLMVKFPQYGCSFRYLLSGKVAAIDPAQRPTDDCAGSLKLLTAISDKLSLEGASLGELGSGKVQFLGPSGPMDCDYALAATLGKTP